MSRTVPNACLSCRQRKLKCDRQSPCANCVARSLDCRQQLLRPSQRGQRLDGPGPAMSDIITRLDQIESQIGANRNGDCLVSTPIGDEIDRRRVRAMAPALSKSTSILGPTVKAAANDSILQLALTHRLSVRVSDNFQKDCLDSGDIILPTKGESLSLFQVYFQYVGQFQHIIYEPRSRMLVDHVYDETDASTAPPGLALVLSVIAIAVTLEPLYGRLDEVLPVHKHRLKISAAYIRAAMDCLEQHRRMMNHTVESVQAMIILLFLVCHIEGFSHRYRALVAEAVVVSQGLGLHFVDSGQADEDSVAMEMKRRVWWYLAATDWMVSTVEGPSDAVYLIQPRLTTNIPRHINDHDLGSEVKDRPLSEPTTMSYNLQRLKVAEIARCIADAMPHDMSDPECETIVSLDSKLELIFQGLPTFFRADSADSDEVKLIDQKHTHVPMQRLLLNFMINLLRCRVHFPYLCGKSSSGLHVFSRTACLKAARNILSVHQNMIQLDLSHSSDFMKIQGMVASIFLGSLVLATDLCCNQPRGEDRKRQSTELTTALRQLYGIKQHSKIAAKLLDTLTDLLMRYGVWSSLEGELAPSVDEEVQASVDESLLFQELWDTFVDQPSALDMIDIL